MAREAGVLTVLHPPGDFVSDEVRRTGWYYEAEILDAIRRRVRAGVIVDVGAHIGNHSVYFARFLAPSAVHAFEPIPANLALLRHNAAAYPAIHVHAFALSDRPGSRRMVSEPNMGHSRITAGGPIAVRALPLDSFGLHGVTLIKIDVEEHEPAVLGGAIATIERSRPLVLIEDWTGDYGALLPGYRLAEAWPDTRQTYLYEPT